MPHTKKSRVKNLGTGMLGKKHTEETKRKMSISRKVWSSKNPHPSLGKTGILCHNFGKHASQETKNKMSQNRIGNKNSNWKGGCIKSKAGYIYIKQRNHPRADKKGYVPEHVLIAEKVFNKLLPHKIDVHHINGNPSDNRHENLLICSHSFHIWLHKNNRISERQ